MMKVFMITLFALLGWSALSVEIEGMGGDQGGHHNQPPQKKWYCNSDSCCGESHDGSQWSCCGGQCCPADMACCDMNGGCMACPSNHHDDENCMHGKPPVCNTETPTYAPSQWPTEKPTETPTLAPTYAPTYMPTYMPTEMPTYAPTQMPTEKPTEMPSEAPTCAPKPPPKKWYCDSNHCGDCDDGSQWSCCGHTCCPADHACCDEKGGCMKCPEHHHDDDNCHHGKPPMCPNDGNHYALEAFKRNLRG